MPNTFFKEDKETYEQGQISFQKEWGHEYGIKTLSITGAGSDTTASSEPMIFKFGFYYSLLLLNFTVTDLGMLPGSTVSLSCSTFSRQ